MSTLMFLYIFFYISMVKTNCCKQLDNLKMDKRYSLLPSLGLYKKEKQKNIFILVHI